jgi:prepilin-type N-terminal cleavage/methylation domain-containing protein
LPIEFGKEEIMFSVHPRSAVLARRLTGRQALGAQSGMTLLEILIVLAIIAVVMGLLFGPQLIRSLTEAKVKETRIIVTDFASKAYTQWSLNSGETCPQSLEELKKYTNVPETKDAWGRPLTMVCAGSGGGELPEGIPFGVVSAGEDGQMGTADDIKSWEAPKKEGEKKQ